MTKIFIIILCFSLLLTNFLCNESENGNSSTLKTTCDPAISDCAAGASLDSMSESTGGETYYLDSDQDIALFLFELFDLEFGGSGVSDGYGCYKKDQNPGPNRQVLVLFHTAGSMSPLVSTVQTYINSKVLDKLSQVGCMESTLAEFRDNNEHTGGTTTFNPAAPSALGTQWFRYLVDGDTGTGLNVFDTDSDNIGDQNWTYVTTNTNMTHRDYDPNTGSDGVGLPNSDTTGTTYSSYFKPVSDYVSNLTASGGTATYGTTIYDAVVQAANSYNWQAGGTGGNGHPTDAGWPERKKIIVLITDEPPMAGTQGQNETSVVTLLNGLNIKLISVLAPK